MVVKLPEGEKQMWNFWLFKKILSDKVETVFRESKSELLVGFILKFVGGSILEIGFEATLKLKTNVLSIWKWSF